MTNPNPVYKMAVDSLGRQWYRVDCPCGCAAVEGLDAERLTDARCIRCESADDAG